MIKANRKRGFTLVEGIVSLLIISIVIITSLNFYRVSKKLLLETENQGHINSNLRIAQEFIVDKVRNSNDLILDKGSIFIDGKRLFVEKNILRYNTASQQISTDIVKVSVENMENSIYRITVSGEYETISTIVKRGDITWKKEVLL